MYLAVIPAKAGIQFKHAVRSTQQQLLCPSDAYLDWMIRCAHPFGAILRMFFALRATSGLRRNDG
jgi:hypothetical protein